LTTAEQERWAEALAIERRYGSNAGKHIARRMFALVKAGDDAGVARWAAIASKLDQLRDPPYWRI
jgi:hypothetical protein